MASRSPPPLASLLPLGLASAVDEIAQTDEASEMEVGAAEQMGGVSVVWGVSAAMAVREAAGETAVEDETVITSVGARDGAGVDCASFSVAQVVCTIAVAGG